MLEPSNLRDLKKKKKEKKKLRVLSAMRENARV
jgi:hypothetical protein